MRARTVLIVDDDFAVHGAISRALEPHGVDTVSAGSLAAAKAALGLCRVDALLIDTVLGPDNGWNALSELRTATTAPAALLSAAEVDDDVREDARRLGAAEVLPKPVESDALVTAVLKMLGVPGATAAPARAR